MTGNEKGKEKETAMKNGNGASASTRDRILADGWITWFRSEKQLTASFENVKELSTDDREAIREAIEKRHQEMQQWDVPRVRYAMSCEFNEGRMQLRWNAPGDHLAERAKRKRLKSDPEKIRSICRQLAESLAGLHEQGLGHGCVIPQTVWGRKSLLLTAAELGPWVARHRERLGEDHLRYLPTRSAAESASPNLEEVMQRADRFALGRLMLDLILGVDDAREFDQRIGDPDSGSTWESDFHKKAEARGVHGTLRHAAVRLLTQYDELRMSDVLKEFEPERGSMTNRQKMFAGVVLCLTLGLGIMLGSIPTGNGEANQPSSSDPCAQLRNENDDLKNQLQACRSGDGVNVDVDVAHKEVCRVWREWVRREAGTIDDLQSERRNRVTDWERRFGKATADYISERLETRLRDVERQHQWQMILGPIQGVEEDRLWLRLEIDGEKAWGSTRIELARDADGNWSVPRDYRAIQWRLGQTIRIRLQGWTWRTTRYYTIIDREVSGPLCIFQLGMVTDMGWPADCDSHNPPVLSSNGKSMQISFRPSVVDIVDRIPLDFIDGEDQ